MVKIKFQQMNAKLLSYTHNYRGFSLVEILVSTIVMTLMMVSVISYVQYGSEIWQRGHSKISARNYSRMAFDLIKQDLMKARVVTLPLASTTVTVGNSLSYKLTGVEGTFTFNIATPTERVLYRSIATTTVASYKIWNSRIARHVNLFRISRISTWTFQIDLQIKSDSEASEDTDSDGDIDFDDRSTVSSESIVLLAPGAGG